MTDSLTRFLQNVVNRELIFRNRSRETKQKTESKVSNYGGNYYFTSPVWLHSLVADAREVLEENEERLLMVLLIELEFCIIYNYHYNFTTGQGKK